MQVLSSVASFLIDLFSMLVRQLVLGLGLLAGLGLLLFVVQRWTQTLLVRAIGWRGLVCWTGWLGTPVHEMSHVVVGFAFRVKIVEVRLFQPDPRTGVLGYVRYQVPRLHWSELHRVIGTFLMGIAPLFGGALVLLAAFRLLIPGAAAALEEAERCAGLLVTAPPSEVWRGLVDLVRSVYGAVFAGGAASPRPWLFLYVALAVGNHLAPSRADLEGGMPGLLVLGGLAIAANAVALLVRVHVPAVDPLLAVGWLARATGPLAVLLLLALTLNCGNLALASVLALIMPRRAPAAL